MSDRRKENRAISTFKGAYVRTREGLYFVTLRNISESGLSFDGAPVVGVGERIECCFDALGPRPGIVKWISGSRFGVAIEAPDPDNRMFPPRSVRLPLSSGASLFIDGCCFGVTLHNLSLRGVCVSGTPRLQTGRLVSVDIARRSFDLATVRWSAAGRTGIRFAKAIPMAEFSAIVDRLRESADDSLRDDFGTQPLPARMARSG